MTSQPTRTRRYRLAANSNEGIVDSLLRAQPDDETLDTEGHRLAANDNETTVQGLARIQPEDDDDSAGDLLGTTSLRR